jgi:Immunoglobulin I-set domain
MRYVVEKDALNVKQVKVTDSGIYVCTATNEAGTDQQAFTLEVISEWRTSGLWFGQN